MSELKAIIKQICAEKGISEDSVYETINAALAAAYRKDFGDKDQNVVAEYDVVAGDLTVFDEKTVVKNLTKKEITNIDKLQEMRDGRKAEMEEKGKAILKTDEELALEEETRKFNPKTELELKDAKKIDKEHKVEDIIRTPLEVPGNFGRMAAQTAKQVIIQKLREAERDIIFENYKDREGEILHGIVQKRDGRNMVVDLDNVSANMPLNEQIRNERFNLGDRIKVVLLKVEMSMRGPEIVVSRAHPLFVQRLFETEIPEIAAGVIEIKNIAREAGSRSKVAVYTADENIDPIGSCIGQRGARIQIIINELNGEKIDIIQYDEDPTKYISHALAPAKIQSVELNEKEKTALVTVPADQLSLTIGREGQNVRLAVKLTDWKINIKEQDSVKEITDGDEEKTEDTGEKETKENKELGIKNDADEKEEKPKKKKAVKKVKDDVAEEKEAKPKKKKAVKKVKDEASEEVAEEKEEKPKKKKAVKKDKKIQITDTTRLRQDSGGQADDTDIITEEKKEKEIEDEVVEEKEEDKK